MALGDDVGRALYGSVVVGGVVIAIFAGVGLGALLQFATRFRVGLYALFPGIEVFGALAGSIEADAVGLLQHPVRIAIVEVAQLHGGAHVLGHHLHCLRFVHQSAQSSGGPFGVITQEIAKSGIRFSLEIVNAGQQAKLLIAHGNGRFAGLGGVFL